MSPRTLLALYPRAWRDRYGDEFLETVRDAPPGARLSLDIMLGALDAWVAPQRGAGHAMQGPGGGGVMTTIKTACGTSRARLTTRDGLMGAGAMLAVVLLMTTVGVVAGRGGWHGTRDVLTSAAFPVSLVVSMPFTFSKGHPWKTQAVLVGVPTILLLAMSTLALWL